MTQIWGMGSCKMGCTSSWSLSLRPKAANIAELDHRFSGGKPLFAVQGISIRGYISHEDDGILDIQLSFAKSLMATWYRIEIVLAIRHSFPTSWACSLQNYLGSTTNGMDTRTFAGLSCKMGSLHVVNVTVSCLTRAWCNFGVNGNAIHACTHVFSLHGIFILEIVIVRHHDLFPRSTILWSLQRSPNQSINHQLSFRSNKILQPNVYLHLNYYTLEIAHKSSYGYPPHSKNNLF